MKSAKLIYKIAVAYHEQGLTQAQIANNYGLSRVKVSRMLSRAEQEGIVQVRILTPEDSYVGMETQLEMTFGLGQVIITGDEDMTEREWLAQAGKATADYFLTVVQGNEVIGLTWGRALQSFVRHIPLVKYPKLKIVQMLGGLGMPDSPFHGADICRTMAQQCGTRPSLIHAPGIVGDKEVCKSLKENLQVKGTLELAARADMAFVGIGSFGPDSPIRTSDEILGKEEKNLLSNEGAVGDISLRFFREDGHFIRSELDERVVGIGADELAGVGRTIGIAGGAGKIDCIRAVVRQRRVQVLITDPATAKQLLKETKTKSYE